MVSIPDRSAPSALATVARRTLEGLLTAWAAVSLTFFALRLAAGDPVAALLSQGLASPQQAQALRHGLGLDLPLVTQYLRFLGSLTRGRLGVSLYTGREVTTIVARQFPYTAALALTGLVVAVSFGMALGVVAAWRERSLTGRAAAAVAGLATAMPVAFTGILAILLATRLMAGTGGAGLIAPVERLALPALVLGCASCGAIARVVHAGLRESLHEPYILAARARGLRRGLRLLWHALRPALPPAVSLGALEAAYLFTGTVVTETVFSRPGLGRLLVTSILQGDFPIVQGLVVLSAVFYTASTLLADVLALLLDPRLRRVG